MAHTCPLCGCYCTCKGDWDDFDLGKLPPGGCVHYLQPDCENEDDDPDDFEEYREPEKLKPTKDGGLHEPETGITHYP